MSFLFRQQAKDRMPDVNDRMQAEIARQNRIIREQKEFAEQMLEHAVAPIFVIDARHKVLIWNRACEELTGIASREVKGTDGHWRAFYDSPRYCLADFVVDGDMGKLSSCYPQHQHSPVAGAGVRAEGWRTLANGRRRYLTFSAAPIRNSRSEVIASIQTLDDLTDRKEAETWMKHLAYFDALTGLPNRLLFLDRLDQAVAAAARCGREMALLYVDLDGFKMVNDTGGHNAGDLVLLEVGRRLKECVRDCDTVARIGGDEFAAILSSVEGVEGARMASERMLGALTPAFHVEGRNFSVGASIGVSLYPAHGRTADLLLQNADTAMYRVKAKGKNHFGFYAETVEKILPAQSFPEERYFT
jgi:diguanylate cyclase (GGDEF)-like protein